MRKHICKRKSFQTVFVVFADIQNKALKTKSKQVADCDIIYLFQLFHKVLYFNFQNSTFFNLS